MKKITLNFDFPDDCIYGVSVEKIKETSQNVKSEYSDRSEESAESIKNEKFIDKANKTLTFVLESGEYKVCVEQYFSPYSSNIIMRLLSVLMLPFLGIYNIIKSSYNSLFQNEDDVSWWDRICAYGIRATFTLNVVGNSEYNVNLEKSTFSFSEGKFLMPQISVCRCDDNFQPDCQIDYTENPISIDIEYRKAIQEAYSKFSLMLLIFAFSLYNYVSNGKSPAVTIAVCIVSLLLFVLLVAGNMKDYKRKRIIDNIFVSDSVE
jgi:hypothetical protein